MINMTKTKLIAKQTVVKLMSSKHIYLKIPENEFNTITHGDIAEVLINGTNDYTDLVYRFTKVKVSDPTKEKISKITTNTKKGK